jgi:hypothetical protein
MVSLSPEQTSRLRAGFRGSGVLRQTNPSSSPSSQPNQPAASDFFFCSLPPFNSGQIRSAISTAKSWMRLAIPMLDLFRMGRLSEEQRTVVSTAIRDNFNTADPSPYLTLLPEAPIDTILNNFKAIEQALNQPMHFFCTTACLPGDLAWVLSNPESFGLPQGIINICEGFFQCGPPAQATTIIHERAHEAIGAKDHFYEMSGGYASMATMTALENADSYAVAARQIANRGVYRPGLSCPVSSSRMPDFQLMEPTLKPPKASGPRLELPELTTQLPKPK